ncbi:hypothetical protein D9Q98_002811 [Chlorella vulgaris]|uniref:tRNA/rRNA methyltransferase SpoU type domain-containing protein n=1 Tax=Chlorella vulgaris TaxID=3077 RepID=A0A9D4YZT4_CHLVU|nr:hypothetical protein D9Q98_002811 [Chlorella vulgaris]
MRVLAARPCCPAQSSGAFAETKCITSAQRHVTLAKRRHLRGGRLTAAAVPQYKLARKSEQDLAAGGDLSSTSGGRFPFKDAFEIAKDVVISGQQVVHTLGPLMTDERIQKIEHVCAARTFNVLPIVEHVYDMGNLAAVCRSADALGLGAVHVVRDSGHMRYKQSTRSSAGADKWLDVQVFGSTQECLLNAKKLGFQLVATHLSPEAVDISEVDWTRPTAFVMGNEERGVTPEAVALADVCVRVPMVGFVDSFNLSVAAALVMYEARRQREACFGALGDLSPSEQALLKAVFFLRHKGQTRDYIQHMLERPPPQWQVHRGGDWGTKAFSIGGGVQRLQTTSCHFWDGCCCWGERILWPGKECRYAMAHNQSVSTFNKEKLRQACEKRGLPFPDLSAPPPPPPQLAERDAAQAAAAIVEDAAAAASREAMEALLSAATATAAANLMAAPVAAVDTA